MWDMILDFGKIVIVDIVLSGDNALIIGMAAAGLAPELRKKAIFYGLIIAAVMRILFAIVATKLLAVPGLLFFGGILLFWVCWSLYKEIKAQSDRKAAETHDDAIEDNAGQPRRTMAQALWTITLADITMSIDNVLAVAAIADGDVNMLVFGLGLAILLMAFAATIIMHMLAKYPWISWLGLAVLLYVSAEMLYRGIFDKAYGVLAYFNIVLN